MQDSEKPKEDQKPDAEKPKHWTWERVIEIAKLVATVWVGLLGTIVTMQYNARQHELNQIEAIAKILPHLSSVQDQSADHGRRDRSEASAAEDVGSRDGAIWAAFRIANNKVMLRDLAALYPEDIYRVVSSIAATDGLKQDDDALRALEVASEKLADRYANNPEYASLSARLLDQAARIKQHREGKDVPLNVIDLSADMHLQEGTEQTSALLASMNQVAQMHLDAAAKHKGINTERSTARLLFARVRELGLKAKPRTAKINEEIIKSDLVIAQIFQQEGRDDEASNYLLEAKELGNDAASKKRAGERIALLTKAFEKLDTDRDGKISRDELKAGHESGIISDEDYAQLDKSFDEIANAHLDSPVKVSGASAKVAPVYKDATQSITLEDLKAAASKI